jgi:putative ABC transport system permease protein
VEFAISDYRENKIKTFLSCLGIIIGVMAIITLLTASAGVFDGLTERFGNTETDTIVVYPHAYNGIGASLTDNGNVPKTHLPSAQLTDRDVDPPRDTSRVAAVYPEISTAEDVTYRNESVSVDQVKAVVPGMCRYGDMVESGRFLSPANGDAVAIGSNLAKGTFSGEVRISDFLTIYNHNGDRSQKYEVVGVLRQINTSSVTGDPNGAIFMTRTGFKSIDARTTYTPIVVKSSSVTDVEATAGYINATLAVVRGKEEYAVVSSQALTETIDQIFAMITYVLTAISATFLVVSGIGIMNVMLLTVNEQVKEIVCIMLFIVLASTTVWVEKSLSDSMSKYAGQIYVKSPSTLAASAVEFPPLSSSLTMDKANGLLNLSGLDKSKCAPLLFVQLAPPEYPGGPPVTMAVGVPEGSEKAYYSDAKFTEGKGTLSGKDQVVLGAQAAMYYKVKLGDKLTIMNRNLTVAGIADVSDSFMVNNMVLMPLSTAQDMFNRESVITVLLAPASMGEMDSLISSVRTNFPQLELITQQDLLDGIDAMMANTRTFLNGINAVMLMVAGIVTLMVMVMSVSERTKEIGMLRAIGASRVKVLTMIIDESIIICMLGSALGIVLSFVMMQPWYSAIIASLGTIVEAVLFMTIIGVLAGLYPAYKAAKIQPVEALRYE